jgi:hypothetical protein
MEEYVTMGFPGTWMTESESVVYRVVPKCACSTIGQIMYLFRSWPVLSTATSMIPPRPAQMGASRPASR